MNVLFFHDHEDLGPALADHLEVEGHTVTFCDRVDAAWEVVDAGLSGADVLVLHKDLGQYS